MNEFEKTLQALEPANGKTDVMQIMFRAGQQSSVAPGKTLQPNKANAATFWKAATGLMTAACLLLGICLSNAATTGNDAPSKTIAKPESTSAIVQNETEDTSENQISFAHPEPQLDDPDSWSSLGHRAHRLRQLTAQEPDEAYTFEESTSITPFTYRRTKSNDTF